VRPVARCATGLGVDGALPGFGGRQPGACQNLLLHAVLQGWASTELPESKERPEGANLGPLLDAIVRLVPPPGGALATDTKVSLKLTFETPLHLKTHQFDAAAACDCAAGAAARRRPPRWEFVCRGLKKKGQDLLQ